MFSTKVRKIKQLPWRPIKSKLHKTVANIKVLYQKHLYQAFILSM